MLEVQNFHTKFFVLMSIKYIGVVITVAFSNKSCEPIGCLENWINIQGNYPIPVALTRPNTVLFATLTQRRLAPIYLYPFNTIMQEFKTHTYLNLTNLEPGFM